VKSTSRQNTIVQRLNIIRGQVIGLARLIEENQDCNKVTEQFYAINLALKKAVEKYLKDNLAVCLKSLNSKQKQSINFLLEEIIKNK